MATLTMPADPGLYKVPPSLDSGIIAQLVAHMATNGPHYLLNKATNFGTPTNRNAGEVHSPGKRSGIRCQIPHDRRGGHPEMGVCRVRAGGFRLDLQNIENGRANISVQNNAARTYTLAKCMMKTNVSFGQGESVHARLRSAQRRKTCWLPRACPRQTTER